MLHPERGDFENSCIVVSNHPSTLMDPLNVVLNVKRQVFFLANASLYKSTIGNWFFSRFYCLPVERYQDTGGKPLDNQKTFQRAINHLSNNGIIYVAPEGSSYVERYLRKIKTGSVRIAMDAERENDFQLGLTFLPVGLTYGTAQNFRDEVLVNFGEPIRVADYKELLEEKGFEAIKILRDHIAGSLAAQMITTEDKEEDQLVRSLERICQNEEWLEVEGHFHRTKRLIKNLHDWRMSGREGLDEFKAKTFKYQDQLDKYMLSDRSVKEKEGSFWQSLFLIVGFPVFLFGAVNHFLPVRTPGFIHKWLKLDEAYDATVKYVSGLVLFPFFYWLQTWLVGFFSGSQMIMWTYFLLLIPTGLFTEWYIKKRKLIREKRRAAQLIKESKDHWESLKKTRSELLETLYENLLNSLKPSST